MQPNMKIKFCALISVLLSLLGSELHAGNLKVNLTPSQAVSAGAKWRVDGGTWRNSGTTVSNLSNTTHVVSYKSTFGWITPANANVTLSSGVTTTITGTYVSPASLKINLTPTSGQWRIDGGTWRTNGTTVTGLTPGVHNVDYQAVSGYTAPIAESVTLTAGQTTTLTRSYVQLAQLTITLTPSSGQWRVDGGAWSNSGTAATGLLPGNHTVDYFSVSGYAGLASESISLTAGQSLTLSRSYTQLSQLIVTLAPGSAQWRIDSGAWQASGVTLANLTPGAHTVDYAALAGYTVPASESVTLTSGQTLSINRSYIQLAQLSVTLTPSWGQWNIDGGAWQASGSTVQNLSPGSHTISYSTLTNNTSPATETITLAAGQSLSLARSYEQLAQILISLVPSTGQWRANNGTWQASSTSLFVLPGNYLIEYLGLTLYDSPASENLTLGVAGVFATTRYYTSQKPTLRIHLTPTNGQWRADGGAWQASGAQLVDLDAGPHTIDYLDLGGIYSPIPSEAISLALRENATITRTYPPKPATVTINLTPAQGQWRIYPSQSAPSGAWQAGGATVTGLVAGSYAIEYASLTNYGAPAAEIVDLTAGQSFVVARNYTPLSSLSITLDPTNAQWRLDAGAWNPNGTTLNNLTPGTHTVEYQTINGYITPASESVELIGGQSLTFARTYVQLASVYVSFNPNGIAAQWRIDGGAWRDSGSTFTGIAAGSHTITYSTESFHSAPPDETVTINAGDQLAFTRTYTPLTQISMNLTPTGGQWRLDQGAWRTSGLSEDLTPGGHSIEYLPLDGYDTPPAETITLAAGQTHWLYRSYGLFGQLSVSLDPGSAQWRVDGGAWQSSGTTVNNLSVAQHLVEYQNLPGYIAPAQESVTISAGATTQLTRTYTADPAFAIIHSFADAGTLPTALRGSDGMIYVAANTGVSNGLGHLFRINPDGTGFQRLKWFGSDPSDGVSPKALIEGSDGVLYGTTLSGPGSTTTTSNGRVYRINKDGTGYAVLYIFGQVNQGAPNSLLEGADGVLYGTTSSSGSGAGKVFKINRDGSGFTILLNLTTSYGSTPQGLVQAPSGVIYGTARSGGSSSSGALFKFNPDGTGYAMVKGFAGGADGADPRATLLVGSDQMLYGTTYAGGAASRGLVYRLNQDGSGYQVLRSFTAAPDGIGSEYALVEDTLGALYGTTLGGGASNRGTLFRINKDGTGYTVVWSFSGTATDGGQPKMKLVPLGNGTFAGTTTIGGAAAKGMLFTIKDDGSNFSVLRQLGLPAGGYPWSPVISGGNGVLYGTTYLGGTAGTGTIFRINEDGSGYSVLQSLPGPTGGIPVGALLLASNGALYGTTYGSNILFRINTDGSGFTVLQNFGAGTWSGVIEGSDGALYGVTLAAVYRIAQDGSGLTTLHTFAGGATDGTTAHSGLLEGADGRLYGLTYGGGSANAGVIFALNKDGTGYTILRHFLGGATDGGMSFAEMIQDSDGALYGSTYGGGPGNFGTLFKINPDGTGYTVLRIFTGATNDGAVPSLAGLLEKDGFLYGATSAGGSFNKGTVYRLHKDGTGFEILVNFGLTPDDAIAPYSGLIEGSNGRLFGTTTYGADAGAIFRLRIE